MRAIVPLDSTNRFGVGETAEPDVAYGDLLVSVRATALNRADLLQKRGLYPPPPGASPILGLEMAGVVEEGAGPWKPGDRVMALLPGGGYAERARIPSGMAMRIPDTLSFEEAAAIPEVFLTAYLNLFQLGGLRDGQTALVHAGASGVGTAAIQLAREAGVRTLVTAGSQAKREACLALGADAAFDYRAGPFAPEVQRATGGRGVNVILDFVGASYWEQNLDSLAVDGKLIIVGTMGGTQVPGLDLGRLLARRLQVLGTALRSQPPEKKVSLTAAFADFALPRFASGRLKPIVDSVWDWADVEQAHAHMEANRNIGKIVLRVQ
ncbi:NAD(P)H-quinone oxidoreductase [Cohnella lubricantis]|uniref:NAD(P)H-quinone oxidoreductase n=1 Tax=Cohnella lubricantis TaxID=2163172 RepID=A0A841TA76_9BACL|nr:NAD(P)H-quinone oxidoreductase [Cohnella lubricantis]MBB6677882.1 NAD(P)H-quinone oxidoreductase [Cohnella lubricantis]MBP2119064.1 putative PIG3 family NAD(P)H quinone oxidoreductase [Cohnella lubricantis]